jgi:hypothetical protein
MVTLQAGKSVNQTFKDRNLIQGKVPPKNIMAMWETLQEFGKY